MRFLVHELVSIIFAGSTIVYNVDASKSPTLWTVQNDIVIYGYSKYIFWAHTLLGALCWSMGLKIRVLGQHLGNNSRTREWYFNNNNNLIWLQ